MNLILVIYITIIFNLSWIDDPQSTLLLSPHSSYSAQLSILLCKYFTKVMFKLDNAWTDQRAAPSLRPERQCDSAFPLPYSNKGTSGNMGGGPISVVTMRW